jgi:uncharacterized protein YfkK (UPF0435 family)
MLTYQIDEVHKKLQVSNYESFQLDQFFNSSFEAIM